MRALFFICGQILVICLVSLLHCQQPGKLQSVGRALQGVRAVLSRRLRLRSQSSYLLPPLCGLDSSFRSVRSSLRFRLLSCEPFGCPLAVPLGVRSAFSQLVFSPCCSLLFALPLLFALASSLVAFSSRSPLAGCRSLFAASWSPALVAGCFAPVAGRSPSAAAFVRPAAGLSPLGASAPFFCIAAGTKKPGSRTNDHRAPIAK